MSAMREIKTQSGSSSGTSRRRRKRRRRKRSFGVPAPVVFYAVGAFAAMSAGLVYVLEGPFLVFSILSCVLLLAALIINERTGFYRSRRARRPTEPRDKMNMLEVGLLFVLLILNIFLIVYVLAT